MNIVLTNIGPNIQPYIIDSIRQAKRHMDNTFYVLCSKQSTHGVIAELKKLNVNIVFYEDYADALTTEFDRIKYFETNFPYLPNKLFWRYSAERLFYLNSFMQIANLQEVLHFENDVMLYDDLNKYIDGFKSYENIAMPEGSYKWMISSVMFVNKKTSLQPLCEFLLNEMKTRNNEEFMKYWPQKHSSIKEICMVCEMAMLRVYREEMGDEFIDILPSIPVGSQSKHMDRFGGTLFDPAGYGQFLGGNFHHKKPGVNAIPEWNHIRHFIEGNKVDIVYNGTPTLNYNGKVYAINNLHIHCKRLGDFT